MKKTILYFTVFLFAIMASAQEFNVDTNVINAGIGIGGQYGGGTFSSGSPVLSASYERGMWEAGPGVISLGGFYGRKTFKLNSNLNNAKWSYNVFGVRSAFHYDFEVEKLDTYGGVMLAYNSLSTNNELFGNGGDGLSASLYIGGRYYLADNIAAFAEIGYGVSNVTIGAAFRF